MQVYKDIENLPRLEKPVITVGTFDGVHLGHIKILSQLTSKAKAIGGTSVVITFFPHPKRVVASTKNPLNVLNSQDEKYGLLEKAGVDVVVEVPFNEAFAGQSADDYIDGFLFKRFSPHTIIIGYDHRFGRNREGNIQMIEEKASEAGIEVIEIAERLIDDVTISSTKVRDALHDGDPEMASQYLGYPYFFTGTVVEGNKLGRKIGFPTANLVVAEEEKLIPANGVYAVDVSIDGDEKHYKGMMNIGVRPTVDGTKRVTEVNIFDFDEEIYGSRVTVTVLKRIRDEIKFDGVDALKAQLAKDKNSAVKLNP